MTQLYRIPGLFPNPYTDGFAANLASLELATDNYLTGWSTDSPGFNSGNFNTSTGIFTVPATGLYAVEATLNYSTKTVASVTLGDDIYPLFELQKTDTPSSDLIIGYLPIFNFASVVIVTLRTVLNTSTITLTDIVSLSAGQHIQLHYTADSLTIPIIIKNTQWSMYRIA